MHNKLVTASYIHKDSDSNATAHAVSASLNTGHGLDFHVAAISQKQAFFADGDTPRVALISFLTGLQSRKDSEIEKIILGGVLQAAGSVHAFIRQKGGSPCSLTAAIVHDNQLYTVQIGSGKVLIRQNQQLINPNQDLEKVYAAATWLGESAEFSAKDINLNIVDELDEQNDLSILVCQPSLANRILEQQAEFNEIFENISAKHQVRAIPKKLAEWAKEKYFAEQVTLATIHTQTTKFVDFFTLHEALLSPTADISSTIISSKAKPVDVIKNYPADTHGHADHNRPDEAARVPEPAQNGHLDVEIVEVDGAEIVAVPQSDVDATESPNTPNKPEAAREAVNEAANEEVASQGPNRNAPKEPKQSYSAFDTIIDPRNAEVATVSAEPESDSETNESFVLFSAAQTIPVPAVDVPAAAPVTLQPVDAAAKPDQPELSPAVSTVSINGSNKSQPPTETKDAKTQKSWSPLAGLNLAALTGQVNKRTKIGAALAAVLLILSAGFLLLRGRDNSTEPEEIVAVIKTSTIPPTRITNITPNCLDNPSSCITPTTFGVVLPPTATNTPLPTSTANPTATPEANVILVGRVYESFSNTGKLIFPGEQVGSSSLARIVFANQTDDASNLDEIYLLPDSVIDFVDTLNPHAFNIESGSSLIIHSTQNLVSAGISLQNEEALQDHFNVLNGCMSIDYVNENEPVTVACYSGACAWSSANGNGVQRSLDPGTQIEFIPAESVESDSGSSISPTQLDPQYALNLYINLATVPSSQVVSAACLEEFLPKPTSAPTSAPSPTPTAVPPTAVPPTQAPSQQATAVPPTSVPPTSVPPTSVPPTAVPPTAVPPTSVPPTAVPPTAAPPTEVPPTAIPPTPVRPATATPTPLPPPTATPEQLPERPTVEPPPPGEGDEQIPPTSTPISGGR